MTLFLEKLGEFLGVYGKAALEIDRMNADAYDGLATYTWPMIPDRPFMGNSKHGGRLGVCSASALSFATQLIAVTVPFYGTVVI